MGIRMSGLVSGLDTDSIIKELMSAQSQKKVKIQNKITKNEWTQEKWKELNSKIYNFHKEALNKFKLQGSYQSKKVTSSNEAKVSVKASNTAVEGSHSIKVSQLAKSQYVTSAKLSMTDEEGNAKSVTSSTKLTDLGMTEGTTITIATDRKSYDFDVSSSSTINDFLTACKSAGLTASYDTNQSRLFISSSASGADNAFSITTSISSATADKNLVRDAVGFSSQGSANRASIDEALLTYATSDDSEKVDAAYEKLVGFCTSKVTSDYTSSLTTAYKNYTDNGDSSGLTSDELSALSEAALKAENDYINGLNGRTEDAQAKKTAIDRAVSTAATTYANKMKKEFTDASDNHVWAEGANPYADAVNNMEGLLDTYKTAVGNAVVSGTDGDELGKIGLTEISYTKSGGEVTYNQVDGWEANGGAIVGAADSIIEYNGATLISSSNTITANGLTFTVQDVTAGNEAITLTVSKDTDTVYNMVKDFVKGYNALMDEMNTAYNAKSARGFEPLTDDEREAMTDDQIEKWETKIKDSLLRRDSTLNGVISTMRNTMASQVDYNGKTYSLASFGISTKVYTELGKLHIAGDMDDTSAAGDADKLRAALSEDPDTVMNVLTSIASNLYDDLSNKMKTSKMSSALTFYDDKSMNKELTKYQEEIKKLEAKLTEMEDRYYKQFTAMEKALSSINSQSNSFASAAGL